MSQDFQILTFIDLYVLLCFCFAYFIEREAQINGTVLANSLFSLRDINSTLGLLPPEDTWHGVILWVLRVLG